MRKLAIAAIVFASCASFAACSRELTAAGTSAIHPIDSTRYRGDEASIKDIETTSPQTLGQALTAIERTPDGEKNP